MAGFKVITEVMAGVDQLSNHSRTNKSGRARNENTHMNTPILELGLLRIRSLLVLLDWNRGVLSGYCVEIGKHLSGNLPGRRLDVLAKMIKRGQGEPAGQSYYLDRKSTRLNSSHLG